jgi:PqqD family protein of HPr-rel-A system
LPANGLLTPLDTSAPIWRLASLVDLHWRRWDEEWVVFDAGSGKTHKIDTLTAVTLMVLESGPASAAAIEAAVARELLLDEEATKGVNSRLVDLLAGLRQAGLAETIAG